MPCRARSRLGRVRAVTSKTRLSESSDELNQLLRKIIDCFETFEALPLVTSPGQTNENMMERHNKCCFIYLEQVYFPQKDATFYCVSEEKDVMYLDHVLLNSVVASACVTEYCSVCVNLTISLCLNLFDSSKD